MHGAEAKQVAHQTMTVVMQHAHASKQHQVATEDDKEASNCAEMPLMG